MLSGRHVALTLHVSWFRCSLQPVTHQPSSAAYCSQGQVADSFGRLGDRASDVARLCSSTSSSLASSFEAPLKEFVRGVRAVKKVCADRSAALAAYQQVGHDWFLKLWECAA